MYFYGMFVREKRNKSGVVSVQVIDKSGGKYKVAKTIGSSSSASEISRLVLEGERYIRSIRGIQEIDFHDYRDVYTRVLSSISTHKLVGVRLVLGSIFEQIGFHAIEDDLFRELVLYRIIYPKSKLKTTEYLYRFEQKSYSEDEVYRYMDKLNKEQTGPANQFYSY